ncbi:probable WRKY transcription factor 38 isoform X2 [Brachypodium distachyon]|uniref:probable WRKY transcription factor 38 isoform X2 n=1 Tax=Brachypodium distachyon TaxID=15368 RepID=UPI000D0CF46E|nr:probable WRKY transcription factor 38 isoform X2 [Brachypodium distachyon]|eukprot:XP_024315525.1 probable WRKY transcription factor 38 isoform X2 [Brachypodium distachyon]
MAKSGGSSSSGSFDGANKRPLQDSVGGCAQEHAKNRKTRVGVRTDYTYAPYHDGFQWRKYGQKMIRGNIFPRCYYRCTYHQDHGCPASKHVEQSNSEDPPLFRVIYTNDHTCSGASEQYCYMASSMQIQQIADASLRKPAPETTPAPPLPQQQQLARRGRAAAYAAAIKQEKDAIVSSLLTVIRGCEVDVVKSEPVHENYGAGACMLSPPVAGGASGLEGSGSSLVSPVAVPAPDDLGLDFMVESLDPCWFEPLDLGWFIESTHPI